MLILHFAATLFMAGLIWFVQLVHYPLSANVDPVRFSDHQAVHMTRTGWVVAIPMSVEAITALWLVFSPPAHVSLFAVEIGLALLVFIWIATAILLVPGHNALLQGFDAATHERLLKHNWLRTLAWTARACLVCWIVSETVLA